MRFGFLSLVAITAMIGSTPATAGVTLAYSGSDDAAFEGASGYLAQTRGAALVNGSAMIPLERAVTEVRIGSAGSRKAGLHTPSAASGRPEPVGTGVTQALTNFSPVGGGSTGGWISGAAKTFSVARAGTTITFTFGAESWSETQSYFGDVNSFAIRLRSQSTAPVGGNPLPFVANAIGLTGLSYTDAGGVQALSSLSAADGALVIRMFDGLSGDFTLAGTYTLTFDTPVNGVTRGIGQAALASQIKLLAVNAVPEPASWAMMIGGFALMGAALRRRTMAHSFA